MKYFFITVVAAIAVAATISTPVLAADVGVSINIGEPGFYGRLDIGDYPQPQVIYSRPMIIERNSMNRQPVYLRVPPGHARNWRKHCREYNACGEQVYFVRDSWYNREYVPRYQKSHGNHRDGRGDHRGGDGDQRRDEGHNRNEGRGNHGRDH
ncbi:MAG: hypothetical protein EPO47_05355 [Rugosibacter sp.]|nr:MAG: hypothetical protein EPO47_05355 [Rugosibacter sp.]